ncbi:hypothetical protein Tco_0722884 [Tanacetum coccineum]
MACMDELAKAAKSTKIEDQMILLLDRHVESELKLEKKFCRSARLLRRVQMRDLEKVTRLQIMVNESHLSAREKHIFSSSLGNMYIPSRNITSPSLESSSGYDDHVVPPYLRVSISKDCSKTKSNIQLIMYTTMYSTYHYPYGIKLKKLFVAWFDPPTCDKVIDVIPGLFRSRNQLEEDLEEQWCVLREQEKLMNTMIYSGSVTELLSALLHSPNDEISNLVDLHMGMFDGGWKWQDLQGLLWLDHHKSMLTTR